ncbi:MAG: transglycosylase SLT domain-containing protein [Pseudomonadota bacterium]
MTVWKFAVWSVAFFGVASCATVTPTASEQVNICDIFDDRKRWYRAAAKSEDRWNVPIPLQIAIIKQESSFDKDARPSRGQRRFFGLARGKRPSSARGYAQALDSTWDEYRSSTGNQSASRSDFSDSVDFVGWYVSRSARQTGTSTSDARSQYLAYHEGPGGFSRGTWRGNSALIATANRVAADTDRFQAQLNGCERRLKRRGIFG